MSQKFQKGIQSFEGQNQIVMYKNRMEVRLDADTVWLSLNQMSELFDRHKSVISRHLNNVFREQELNRDSVVAKFATTATDGKIYQVEYYNLDVIISVGYRVKSQQGTQFRIWATQVLKRHLIDGYTINERRLKRAEGKYQELQKAIALMGNVLDIQGISSEARGLLTVITDYTRALDLLDDFDHERLLVPKGTRRARFKLTYDEAKKIIDAMKKKFQGSHFVGQEKDGGFKGSLGAVYQTFGKKDVYPTVEEKAAHLLYFVTKNHSFVDGNKRIAAALFLVFLDKNGILYGREKHKCIDNSALVALTLMIAASAPRDKDAMIKVVLNLLDQRW